MKTYKITSKNQWEHIKPFAITLIISYFIVKVFLYFVDENGLIPFLIGGGTWALVYTLIPHILFHPRYYALNKNLVLKYFPAENEMHIERGTQESVFSLEDIKLMKQVKSHPFAEKRILLRSFDIYNFSIIYLKDGRRFVITSLMDLEFTLPLEESKLELSKSFYAYPTKGHIWEK